jgi:NADH-quinone oxidoreductase subunit M
MLVGIIALYFIYTRLTTRRFLQAMASNPLPGARLWLFLAFASHSVSRCRVSVAHLAAGRAHRSADCGSVILPGVLLKMGTYGLMRFNLALFPEAARAAAWF